MSLFRIEIPQYVVQCDVAGCSNSECYDDVPTKRKAEPMARADGWRTEKAAGNVLWKCPDHVDHKWVRCKTCDGTGGGAGYNCHVCQGAGIG